MMLKKSILLVTSVILLGLSFVGVDSSAQTVGNVDSPDAQHLIITAKGEVSGTMVPFYDRGDIPGLKTGYIDLHYKSENMGFVDGSNSYLTIELPEQFSTIAKQDSFKENISGRVQRKGLTGDKWFDFKQEDIVVYGNQVTFKVPKELWIIHGEVYADISINYGAVQKKYPIRLIQDAPNGYVFKAALRRSMQPWDPIKNPILGTNSSEWLSNYRTAYWE